MRKRYTEEQIIGFLREADAGLPVKELCRKHGFSEPSYYAWKAKFGGMKVSDAQDGGPPMQRLSSAVRYKIDVVMTRHALGMLKQDLDHSLCMKVAKLSNVLLKRHDVVGRSVFGS